MTDDEFSTILFRVALFILLYYLQTSNLESEVIGIYQSIFHSIAILPTKRSLSVLHSSSLTTLNP
jgi:hypothetical protein